MEVKHENLSYPRVIKLMASNEQMQCRKVRRVLRYHTPNKYRFPEKYAHHLVFFFRFDQEKEFPGRRLYTYQGKLAEADVMDIIN